MKSFRRGNRLFAVHINSIKGRDQRIKLNGPNPLTHLGITFSESGLTATLWETVDDKWRQCTEIDGNASHQTKGIALQYRGRGYNLAQWYPEYDWVVNNGYRNFASWVG
jgi:hypothetical protein